MTETTPAEEVAALLAELHTGVTTVELVPSYRRVKRGPGREHAELDWRPHRVTKPGLLTQLAVIEDTPAAVPVRVRRWVRDTDDPCKRDYGDQRDERECAHGRWVHHRTEQRTAPGVVTAGAAVPSGSPGWDADGALSPMVAGSADPGEPVAEAWHVAEQIRQDLGLLGLELHEQGWRPPMTLVDIALADERTGRRIAAWLRGLVQRARIAASYDAPIVTLRDVCCPDCGGDLRVRTDASSAVWCSGRWGVEGPALEGEPWPVRVSCGARWPRGAWVRLLEEAQS